MLKANSEIIDVIEDFCGEKFSEDGNLTQEELDYMLDIIKAKFEKDEEKYKLLEEDIQENYVRRSEPDYEYGY